MKKETTITQSFCDVCEKPAVYTCAGCGADTCADCMKDKFHLYLVNPKVEELFVVCNECNDTPPKEIEEKVALLKTMGEKGQKELKRRNKWAEDMDKLREESGLFVDEK
jgi:hypothetical protein